MSTNDIWQNIHQAQLGSVSERGRAPLTKIDHQPHRTTLHTYADLIASEKNIYITTSEIPKTHTPYTAENSLNSAFSFLYLFAATHYKLVSKTRNNVKKQIREASTGVNKLHKVVTKIDRNLPVFTISPELILSTDDIVKYIFEGKGSDNGSFGQLL